MHTKVIKVAIVEDVAGTRESLRTILDRTPGMECVAACATGEEALDKLPTVQPDVVLMDIGLPGMSGVECVSTLKGRWPKTQVLMLTTYQDTYQIFDSLRAGASGYLLKKSRASEIVDAIKQVHEGGAPMSMVIARKVVNFFRNNRPTSKPNLEGLTEREQEILELLAKGYLYKEIGDRLGISLSTVRGHLHNVYAKLHVQSRTEAVVKYLEH